MTNDIYLIIIINKTPLRSNGNYPITDHITEMGEAHIVGPTDLSGLSKKTVFNIFIIFLEDNCPVQWSMAYEDAKQ